MRGIVSIILAALLWGTAGQAAAQKALRLSGTLNDPTRCGSQADGDNVNTFAYVIIAENVGYKVAPGDKLVYDLLIPNESTLNSGAVDFEGITDAAGGGDRLRDSEAKDQFGLYAHPATDLMKMPKKADGTPSFARGKWVTREISLKDQEGGTMNTFLLAFDEHDTFHMADQCPIDTKNAKVVAYFRNIRFVDKEGKVKKSLFGGEEKLADGQKKHTETLWLSEETVSNQAVEVVDDPSPEPVKK
jgi:hypothetical protein